MSNLRQVIENWLAEDKTDFGPPDFDLFERFKRALNSGGIRAAEPDSDGGWQVNAWVKRAILRGFRMGRLVAMSSGSAPAAFFDRHTYPLRAFDVTDNVRIVPGGTSVRDGSFVAPGVVIMPPSYVNVGAYVDSGTMIDSHVLIGSCAQIGKNVHLSAAVQVGGVLEPAGAMPVIIEDEAFLGGGCGVYEGTIVRKRAVLASGVILSRSTPVFDLVRGEVYRGDIHRPLEIPPRAVVVPGARSAESENARRWGVSLYAAVIVKYRDEKTDAATALEQALR
ncbi:MAG: 2,3,4,5-tetrahydropyridine-2,6-dicarboxylate N-succinyltransferase [Phycisphaerae bacterium]|nr:2,3,4,5-tetrahydropyridine-2,6-dicarboxylate N-succinyltransferase [Phycisphaerae bacterium]